MRINALLFLCAILLGVTHFASAQEEPCNEVDCGSSQVSGNDTGYVDVPGDNQRNVSPGTTGTLPETVETPRVKQTTPTNEQSEVSQQYLRTAPKCPGPRCPH